jgi:hypothetical protein
VLVKASRETYLNITTLTKILASTNWKSAGPETVSTHCPIYINPTFDNKQKEKLQTFTDEYPKASIATYQPMVSGIH